MKPIRAVIADDEPAAVFVIKALLQQFAPDLVVAGTADNGLEAVRMITQLKPELVFLDVNMPVLNGIQVMEKLLGYGAQVILTTGSADYAFKALKLKAVDYLLKPIDPAEFILALDRAQEQLDLRRNRDEQPPIGTARLQLPTQNEIVFIDEANISHVTGMGSYCQINTTSGEKIIVSKNIGHIAQRLSPTLFYRSHNSHIINLDFVAKYLHRDGCFVEMKSGTVLEVSRRSKEGLLEQLARRTK